VDVSLWVAEKFEIGLEARRIHMELTAGKVRQRLEMDEELKKAGQVDFLGTLIDLVRSHPAPGACGKTVVYARLKIDKKAD
jgi:hypothetical protein